MLNTLFVCTSNKDRSPALEGYFARHHSRLGRFKSAGVNKYFTFMHGTHHLGQDDIDWADLIVFAENIHKQIVEKKYKLDDKKISVCLNLGEFNEASKEDYLTKAEFILLQYL